ncbi:hypothetical protein Dimus_030290 [Dionaea muscipula]
MNVIHLKKKDVVKSSVKGVAIEFDHDRMASILGVPGKNRICEYIKDMWEESKYTKPLEITRRFANNETLTAARRVKSGEMKPFQRFIHFLVMKNVIPRFGKRDTSSFMDLTYMDHLMARRIWWIRKRYDYFEETFLTMCKSTRENGVPWVELEKTEEEMMWLMVQKKRMRKKEEIESNLIGRLSLIRSAVEGESGSDEQFYDAQVDVEEPMQRLQLLRSGCSSFDSMKETTTIGVDPSCPTWSNSETMMNKLQAEFERARANRFQADLEKAQAENGGLLALL